MRPTNRAHRLVNTAAAWIRLNLNDKAGFRAKNLRSRADIPSSRLSDPTNLKNEEISFYICEYDFNSERLWIHSKIIFLFFSSIKSPLSYFPKYILDNNSFYYSWIYLIHAFNYSRDQRHRLKKERQNSRRFFGRINSLEESRGRRQTIAREKRRPLRRRPARESSKRQSFPRGTLSSPVSQLVSADAFLPAVWLLRFAGIPSPRRVLPR